MKSQVQYICFLVVEIFIRVVDIHTAFDLCERGFLQSHSIRQLTVESRQPTSHLCHSLLQAVTEGRTVEMLHFRRLNHIFIVNLTLLLPPQYIQV